MKLTEIVAQIPSRLREEIERNQPIADLMQNGISFRELMLSDSTLNQLFAAMKSWEKQTLQLIVNQFATQQFNTQNLVNAANLLGMAGAEVKMGLANLRKKGIIYAIRKHWGENNYCLPSETLKIWQTILMKTIHPCEEQEALTSKGAFDAPRYLILNIFWLLNYIEHNEIILTSKAAIPKRHLLKITKMLHWDEKNLLFLRTNQLIANSYSQALSITLEFAQRLNLIQWGKSYLTLQTPNVREWLRLSMDEMNRQLYRIFRNDLMPVTAAYEHFLTKLAALSYKKWYLNEHFIYWLQEYDIILVFSDWMGFLEAFGWVEQSFDHMDRGVFRFIVPQDEIDESDSATGKFYVQPDFEILVPPDVSFTVCWELTYVSEHIHTDQVGIYRLTEQSLHCALAKGRTLETCIQFLTVNSHYAVPDSILSALKQWANLVTNARLLSQTALLSNEEVQSSLANTMSISPVQHEFVTDIPSRDEVYPSWQTIPTHWWKECRSYHASTRKEIVQTAINWQSLLKLKNLSQEWIIVPKQIEENEKGWILMGWVHSYFITYSQDQWQAIQLILPGFDEDSYI
jgi:hypothetical protein